MIEIGAKYLYQTDRFAYIPVTVMAVDGEWLYILCDLGSHFYTVEGWRTGIWISRDEPALLDYTV